MIEAAPLGSSWYYSLLYCDEKMRQHITALRCFYHTLRHIPFQCQDTELANIKFQWWREECERLKHHTASHPITQSLQTCTFPHENLQLMLEAFAKDSTISLYESEESLTDFYRKTAGLLEKTVGSLYDINKTHHFLTISNNLENLGIFIQRVSHLRTLRTLITKGKIYFSGEALLKHHVTLYELSQLKLTSPIYNLLTQEAQKIHKYYDKTSVFLSSSHLSTFIFANIYHALLREIEHSNFDIFQHMISLTPLRKWWIAWKTKYQNSVSYKSAG